MSFLLIKESGRRTAEGSSELRMLANVPLICGVLQFKCTILSWASPCLKPVGYRQGYCQHISPKYSAEQQVQNGHHVIFAGKLFNNVLRKCKLQLRESWVPQLKLIFSSSYWKFININVLNSKASFFLVSQLSSFVHLCNENNSNEFWEVQCYEYIVTQNMKNRYLCKIVFQSHLTSEVREDGTYMNKLHSPKPLTQELHSHKPL